MFYVHLIVACKNSLFSFTFFLLKFLLFFAFSKLDEAINYDVFSLKKNHSEAHLVGSISLTENENINYSPFIKVHDIDNNFVIAYAKYQFLQENGSYSNALLYMAFDFSNLSDIKIEENNTKEILLSPNPTNNNIRLLLEEPMSGKLNILNLNGQLLKTIDLDYVTDVDIDTSTLPSGYFILKLVSDNGLIRCKTFNKF